MFSTFDWMAGTLSEQEELDKYQLLFLTKVKGRTVRGDLVLIKFKNYGS